MLAFVDIEHPSVHQDPRRAPYHLKDYYQRVINISQATGLVCHTVHYRDFSREWLRDHDIRAFFLSGNTMDWEGYAPGEWDVLWEVLRSGDYPVMGFCGGHQLIGLCFGAECGPLGPLEPGEKDLMPEYKPGMRKEKGHLPFDVVAKDDPLFDGFEASSPVIMESHYWEVCHLPQNFDLLASTPWCHIQVMKHHTLPIYSTQGHPEAYTEEYPDGKRLIHNFALLTGLIER
jgi:GMP synthase-like glutamine amidotransferase